MNQRGVGFSQRIQLSWLELTAQLVIAGQTETQIRAELHERLKDKLSPTSGHEVSGSNRAKAIAMLLKTWATVPTDLEAFRDDGLRWLQQLPDVEHLVVHWGMLLAVYPFFGAVVETAGRLCRLQGNFAAPHVQRRIREQWGERETAARAARRILRCLIDWEVLTETEAKGVYVAAPPLPISDSRLATWLVEAAMISTNAQSGTYRTIAQASILFPFAITSTSLTLNPRLELFRQGLDEDMLMRVRK